MYTMDHPDLNVSNFMEPFICLNRVNLIICVYMPSGKISFAQFRANDFLSKPGLPQAKTRHQNDN